MPISRSISSKSRLFSPLCVGCRRGIGGESSSLLYADEENTEPHSISEDWLLIIGLSSSSKCIVDPTRDTRVLVRNSLQSLVYLMVVDDLLAWRLLTASFDSMSKATEVIIFDSLDLSLSLLHHPQWMFRCALFHHWWFSRVDPFVFSRPVYYFDWFHSMLLLVVEDRRRSARISRVRSEHWLNPNTYEYESCYKRCEYRPADLSAMQMNEKSKGKRCLPSRCFRLDRWNII